MADQSDQLVADALRRAAAEPAGLPLHGSKTNPGLFPNTNPAKLAARRCKDEGFLRVLGTETKGKTPRELCGITEKGLVYLLSEVSPKRVLEELVRALQARQKQVAERSYKASSSQRPATAPCSSAMAAMPGWPRRSRISANGRHPSRRKIAHCRSCTARRGSRRRA